MFFLLLSDMCAFSNLFCQKLVFFLCHFLAAFHKLNGKCKAQKLCNKGVFEYLCFFRLHFQTGVGFPYFIVGILFSGKTLKGFLVFFALGKFCNLFVNYALVKLILLHLLNDCESFFGYLFHNLPPLSCGGAIPHILLNYTIIFTIFQ